MLNHSQICAGPSLPSVAELEAEGVSLLVQQENAVARMQQQHAFLLASAPSLRVQDVPELLRLYKELVLQYTALSVAVSHHHSSHHQSLAPAADTLGMSHDAQTSAGPQQAESASHGQQHQHQHASNDHPAESVCSVAPPADNSSTKLPSQASGPAKQHQQQQPKSPRHKQSPLSKVDTKGSDTAQPDASNPGSAAGAPSKSSAAASPNGHAVAASNPAFGLDDLRPLQPEALQPGQADAAAALEAGMADLAASAQPISFTELAAGHDAAKSTCGASDDDGTLAAAPAADLTSNLGSEPAVPSVAVDGNQKDEAVHQEDEAVQSLPFLEKQAEAVLHPPPLSCTGNATDSRPANAAGKVQTNAGKDASDVDLFSGLSMAAHERTP